MSKKSVTLALSGDVALNDFAAAISRMNQLMGALGKDVAKGTRIDWFLESLEAGSAVATFRGETTAADADAVVSRVVSAYEDVGRSLEEGKKIRYSEGVIKAAHRLTGIINGHVKSVRLETGDKDFEIIAPIPTGQATGRRAFHPANQALGAIRGRVQVLSKKADLRFTLYELIDNRPVSCYLAPGSEKIMKDAWGKIAVVEGLIRRHPQTGHPTTIRDVTTIKILREKDDYKKALGADKRKKKGGESPEQAVRRIRNAW